MYLAWRDPDTTDWRVVGQLSEQNGSYSFGYTKGALCSDKFQTFDGMQDLHTRYVSRDLFPMFKNRILSKKRPEYPEFLQWLGLREEDATPISILGRSGGLRGTDQLQLFKRLEFRDDGSFEAYFFVHGLRYLPQNTVDRVDRLQLGEKLFLCPDSQNEYDADAVLIRADSPPEIIGYCPRYLAKPIKKLLLQDSACLTISVEVLQETAPMNYKLLCKLVGRTGSVGDSPISGDEYELLVSKGGVANDVFAEQVAQ